jgi:polyhydroxybutyrate depolymerase
MEAMRTTVACSLVGLSWSWVVGCSDAPPAANPVGMGGAAGAAASAGAGGVSSAGAHTISGSAGVGTGGGVGGAGVAGGGMAGASAVNGGAGTGGTAGTAGSGGGPGYTPKASAGCGKMNPATGGRMITTGGKTGDFNVNLPANYDPNIPMPLGFGFHGFGNGACGPDQGECRGFKSLPAVTVYMKSLSQGWEQQEILEANISYWQDVLALMKSEYCIDENRVFIAGVSSGGQFIEHLTCRFGDTLWQTTAVCAGVVGSAQQNCKGTPPILVIHGVTDQAGNYGIDVAEMFAERNGCSDMQPAMLQQARDELTAAREAEQAEHICMDWDGCTQSPVRFCISSQITYDGLTHGWPQVGGQLIGEFQATLE